MNEREKLAVRRINALLRQNNPDDLNEVYPDWPDVPESESHLVEEYLLPTTYLEDLKLVAALGAHRLEQE